MEKITINNKTFNILSVTPIVTRKIVTNESMNGSLRAKVYGSRVSLNVVFDEMFKDKKEELEDILSKDSFFVQWNGEEYYMIAIDEVVNFNSPDYDIVGNEIYTDIELTFEEVIPDRQVNSI